MKKILALILALVVVFSFAACGDKGGDGSGNGILGEKQSSSKGQGSGDLIGMWYVESSTINATDKTKSMMFELMDEMYFFIGAQVEFRTDGTTSVNGMIGDYKVPRPNIIETTNAAGEVTECTYTISGDKLTLSFYSDEYVVVLSKTPVEKTVINQAEENEKTSVNSTISQEDLELNLDIDMENFPEINAPAPTLNINDLLHG